MEDTIGITIWLAIMTGCITFLGTSYGLYLTVSQHRIETAVRLHEAAAIAVRRAEAAVVRPLLRDRMLTMIEETTGGATSGGQGGGGGSVVRARMLLFAALQRRLVLSASEKQDAHQYAVGDLVTQLRRNPNPPLRVKTSADLDRHAVRLSELVENAFNLRPRLSTEMIRALGDFSSPAVEFAPGFPLLSVTTAAGDHFPYPPTCTPCG
jgi:hypothetical protein